MKRRSFGVSPSILFQIQTGRAILRRHLIHKCEGDFGELERVRPREAAHGGRVPGAVDHRVVVPRHRLERHRRRPPILVPTRVVRARVPALGVHRHRERRVQRDELLEPRVEPRVDVVRLESDNLSGAGLEVRGLHR